MREKEREIERERVWNENETRSRLSKKTIRESITSPPPYSTSYPLSHLSKMKLSHVFLNVRLRYRIQLQIDANLVLYPTTSMIDSNTCTDSSRR